MTTSLRRGDVVLIPFPFTDLSGHKVRPATVISPDPLMDDLLVAFISSIIPPTLEATDFVLRTSHPAFSQTGLKVASVFKMNKLATLHRTLILRRLGRATDIQPSLDLALKYAVGSHGESL